MTRNVLTPARPLTPGEAAAAIGVDEETARRWLQAGERPAAS